MPSSFASRSNAAGLIWPSVVGQLAMDRVKAVAEFGFNEPQTGFLVTVMQHGGVCVPRQYARFAGVAYAYETAFRDELARPISPRSTVELKWYFEQRKLRSEGAQALADPRFWQAQRAFPNSRYSLLYRRWLAHGDAALEHLCTSSIGEALARGAGRLETVVLPFSYRHLAPLVSLVRSTPSEVEEGEEDTARSQPPHLHSTVVIHQPIDDGNTVYPCPQAP